MSPRMSHTAIMSLAGDSPATTLSQHQLTILKALDAQLKRKEDYFARKAKGRKAVGEAKHLRGPSVQTQIPLTEAEAGLQYQVQDARRRLDLFKEQREQLEGQEAKLSEFDINGRIQEMKRALAEAIKAELRLLCERARTRGVGIRQRLEGYVRVNGEELVFNEDLNSNFSELDTFEMVLPMVCQFLEDTSGSLDATPGLQAQLDRIVAKALFQPQEPDAVPISVFDESTGQGKKHFNVRRDVIVQARKLQSERSAQVHAQPQKRAELAAGIQELQTEIAQLDANFLRFRMQQLVPQDAKEVDLAEASLILRELERLQDEDRREPRIKYSGVPKAQWQGILAGITQLKKKLQANALDLTGAMQVPSEIVRASYELLEFAQSLSQIYSTRAFPRELVKQMNEAFEAQAQLMQSCLAGEEKQASRSAPPLKNLHPKLHAFREQIRALKMLQEQLQEEQDVLGALVDELDKLLAANPRAKFAQVPDDQYVPIIASVATLKAHLMERELDLSGAGTLQMPLGIARSSCRLLEVAQDFRLFYPKELPRPLQVKINRAFEAHQHLMTACCPPRSPRSEVKHERSAVAHPLKLAQSKLIAFDEQVRSLYDEFQSHQKQFQASQQAIRDLQGKSFPLLSLVMLSKIGEGVAQVGRLAAEQKLNVEHAFEVSERIARSSIDLLEVTQNLIQIYPGHKLPPELIEKIRSAFDVQAKLVESCLLPPAGREEKDPGAVARPQPLSLLAELNRQVHGLKDLQRGQVRLQADQAVVQNVKRKFAAGELLPISKKTLDKLDASVAQLNLLQLAEEKSALADSATLSGGLVRCSYELFEVMQEISLIYRRLGCAVPSPLATKINQASEIQEQLMRDCVHQPIAGEAKGDGVSHVVTPLEEMRWKLSNLSNQVRALQDLQRTLREGHQVQAEQQATEQLCRLLGSVIQNRDYWHSLLRFSAFRGSEVSTGIESMVAIVQGRDWRPNAEWLKDSGKCLAFIAQLKGVAQERIQAHRDRRGGWFFNSKRPAAVSQFYQFLENLNEFESAKVGLQAAQTVGAVVSLPNAKAAEVAEEARSHSFIWR